MNLVKWLRKNNAKIMAIVVVVIMFGFIGGSYLQQLARRRTGTRKVVAYFGDNKKITNYDLLFARQELEILKLLRVDYLLRNIQLPAFRARDLQTLFLGELLYPEQRVSAVLSEQVKQLIRRQGYRIADKQVNDFYKDLMDPGVYWFLLKTEAEQAGIRVSNEAAARNLQQQIIPQLAKTVPQLKGATYAVLMGSIVNPPPGAGRSGIAEEKVLRTFAELLSVLEYAKAVCSTENITISQIKHEVKQEEEVIDANVVRFDAGIFAKEQSEPTEQQIMDHFAKYKKFFPGEISDENPFGFGYKLPDMVKLEYMAVKLDDVSKTVTAPTEDEAEEYYQNHLKQMTEQVPSDPNDPNSPLVERTKSYAEASGAILRLLLQQRITAKAEKILEQAKAITDARLPERENAGEKFTVEQLKQVAGDYAKTAQELTKKYSIKVYSGQTGLLSSADIQSDPYLGTMYSRDYGYNPAGLSKIVFAIDELNSSDLGPFIKSKPRMYESIGPLRDMRGQITAIVRVIEARKSSEPESVNESYSKKTLEVDQTAGQNAADVYSVREKVAEDLKQLAAMNTARSKAEEFISLAASEGWDKAVDKFNALYEDRGHDPNIMTDDEKPFEVRKLSNLRRISAAKLEALVVQGEGNIGARPFINNIKRQSQFMQQLYSLVPPEANTVEDLPVIMEFKPDISYYVVKDITIKRIGQEQYNKVKALEAYREDFLQSQSLAATYFNPANILERTKFKWAKKQKEKANESAQSKGAS